MQKTAIEVDERIYEYATRSEGSSTLVFISGMGAPKESWEKVFNAPNLSTCAFAYDRLDIGGSAPSAKPQCGDTIVDALRAILRQTYAAQPYVLVAHSIGGLYAMLYARKYSAEIAGVVFVESAYPHEGRMYEGLPQPRVLRVINSTLGMIGKLRGKRSATSEEHFVDRTSAQIEASGNFPDIPVAVVSGGRSMPFVPKEAVETRQYCQTLLTALSPHSRQFVAANSSHMPQITEPEIVLEAIAWVLEHDG